MRNTLAPIIPNLSLKVSKINSLNVNQQTLINYIFVETTKFSIILLAQSLLQEIRLHS